MDKQMQVRTSALLALAAGGFIGSAYDRRPLRADAVFNDPKDDRAALERAEQKRQRKAAKLLRHGL